MCGTHLSSLSLQCWNWSYWHLHHHRPCYRAGKNGRVCQHTSSDQQDQTAEDEDGADCGRWCVHASSKLIQMLRCIETSSINPTPSSPFPPFFSNILPFPKPLTTHTCTLMYIYTQSQYIFIHDAILESVMCGDTQIDASELRAALHTLRSRTQSRQTGFENQFGVSCVPKQGCGVQC